MKNIYLKYLFFALGLLDQRYVFIWDLRDCFVNIPEPMPCWFGAKR